MILSLNELIVVVLDVDNLEFEGEVTVAWDVLNFEVFELLKSVLADHLMGPEIPDLDVLIVLWKHTKVLHSESV